MPRFRFNWLQFDLHQLVIKVGLDLSFLIIEFPAKNLVGYLQGDVTPLHRLLDRFFGGQLVSRLAPRKMDFYFPGPVFKIIVRTEADYAHKALAVYQVIRG